MILREDDLSAYRITVDYDIIVIKVIYLTIR